MRPQKTNNRFFWSVCICLWIILAFAATSSAQVYRPEAVRREINTDKYQLAVQKNGHIDIRANDGSPIVNNAAPEVVYADGTREVLKTDYRRSQRQSIRGPLGQGNGFLFESEDAEWLIATYPTQPFLTIDLTFINRSKKPVEVARLCPFGTGEDRKGGVHLGDNADAVRMLQPPGNDEVFAAIVPRTEASPGHVAAYHPESQRVFLAGFVTHRAGPGVIRLTKTDEPSRSFFNRFSSEIAFYAPVTVEPGGRLAADTLYVAVGEHNPAEALERFALAAQRLESYPVRGDLHGGILPPGADLQAHVEAAEPMAAFGWTNLALGVTGSPEAGPAIPPVLRGIPRDGLTFSLTVPAPADHSSFLAFLRECRDEGIDTVALATDNPWENPGPRALFEALETENLQTPAVVYPRPVTENRTTLQDWALASRQYYLPPTGNPRLHGNAHSVRQDTRNFSDHQFITAWTLAAMQGALLRPATPFTELSPLRRHILTRLLPAPSASARPIDLFQDGPPQRWVLRLDTPADTWTIVALFNWDKDAATQLDTPVTALGLNNDNYYTVYDFWAGQHLGLIERDLRAEVPAEGVRLFGLRRYQNRPMLIASNRHYTQGASDHTALEWSYDTQTLTGTFDALADTKYTFTATIPAPYALKSVESTQDITEQQLDGSTLTFTITPSTAGPLTWKVTCKTE